MRPNDEDMDSGWMESVVRASLPAPSDLNILKTSESKSRIGG